jgi:signal transduction histidine kinase/ActR/RegA family two-component response regulator
MGTEIHATAESALAERRALLLPPTGADGIAMSKLFGQNSIDCVVLKDTAALVAELQHGAGVLILSEESVVGEAAELFDKIAAQPVWSDLPIVVLSRTGREREALAELFPKLGNVSVVERPIRTSTLLSLVRSSLRARDRQYQVREHLAAEAQAKKEREMLLESERVARSEAEKASRTKDEFLATLGHELRTPLNAVLGWTQVLRKSPALSADVVNGLTVIERNARSQAQIIGDLLDMSSIISGKVRLDVQKLDIASVIETTVETVRPAAQAKEIRLHLVLDPQAGPVRGDPNRLQQVLWNLLTNAVKFTPKGGRVTVTLARVNSHLEIEVLDNGEGIDPAFLPHVFDRFRQADASTTRRHGGLGLGLSIVKQLIELHGGAIRAESAGSGTGSVFRITLPLMPIADVLASDESRQHPRRSIDLPAVEDAPTADLHGLRVLVVDDEPDARALLQRLLQDCNASVVTAQSASEALKLIVSDHPDVLVSDVGMPGEDGYALIRRVRRLGDGVAATPAIALTTYARTEDRVKAIQAGFQVHLSKPVEPIELVAMVQSLAQKAAPKASP